MGTGGNYFFIVKRLDKSTANIIFSNKIEEFFVISGADEFDILMFTHVHSIEVLTTVIWWEKETEGIHIGKDAKCHYYRCYDNMHLNSKKKIYLKP